MKIVTKQMTEGSGSGFVFWPGSGPEKIRGLGSGFSWEVWFGSGPGQHETGSETLSRIWKYHQRQSWATTHHWVRTLPWHRWCQAGSWPESSSARTTYPGTGKYTNSNTNILSIPKLEYMYIITQGQGFDPRADICWTDFSVFNFIAWRYWRLSRLLIV